MLVSAFTHPDMQHEQFINGSDPLVAEHDHIMTVSGSILSEQMGTTLIHEHIMVDFIGADKIGPGRYDQDEVFNKVLPYLHDLKNKGCKTIVECTPAWLGRDVKLLKRLADSSGLNIITNTGYYGAAKEKFIPRHAYSESVDELAKRWIAEWTDGIDHTGIKPGFIKLGVDNYPLSALQEKIVTAAAITHRATGLAIAIHTGDGKAAMQEMEILVKQKVSPAAWIWVHAQNEKNRNLHTRAASQGGWVSFDGFSSGNLGEYLQFLQDMKKQNLLHRVLISHDAGWFHVGETGGGSFRGYNDIFEVLIPALEDNRFTKPEIDIIFRLNPAKAFTVTKRLL
jgi:phosphotriesterase-related protein